MTDKPTLIHLQNSSSQTVLWALEELHVDYTLRAFTRDLGPAPPELKETHPQGKSPQLILPSGRVITQVSAILLYLFRTYDTDHRFHRDEYDPVREEQLIGIGASDLASKLAAKFMFHGMAAMSPFFIRPILNSVRSQINKLVLDGDVRAIMEVLEAEISGQEWFMGGDEPSRPDFILHFLVDLAVQPKYVSLEKYPGVQAFMDRCKARDGWKRSLEAGNGYDLDFPSKW